jgi:hypothetical protein
MFLGGKKHIISHFEGAKKLVQRGLELKKASKIVWFKVRSRGRDAIPVLEIRKLTMDKQRGPWQDHGMHEDSAIFNVQEEVGKQQLRVIRQQRV